MPNFPGSLETVAADLASSLETYVQTIVDAAENKASEITREAEQTAIQKEQDSERRAQEILDAVVTRTSRLLGSIELVESSLRGMIGGLRAELETMTADLADHGTVIETGADGAPERSFGLHPTSPLNESGEAGAASVTEHPADPQVASEPAPETKRAKGAEAISDASAAPVGPESGRLPDAQHSDGDAAVVEETTPSSPDAESESIERDQAPVPPVAAPTTSDVDTPSEAAAEFDRMIHEKTKEMIRNGKSRKDVERFLKRFKRGKQYIEQLDGMFTTPAQTIPSRQGGALRRLFGRR